MVTIMSKLNKGDNMSDNKLTPSTISSALSFDKRFYTPEEKATLVQQYGQKQADYIEKQVNNAQTHADLVSAKRPFAEMNNVSNEALRQQQATATTNETARVKNANPTVKDKAMGLLNPKTLAELAGGYETVTNHPTVGLPLMALGMLGGNAGAIGGAGNILSKIGGSAIPGALGSMVATSPNTVPQGGTATTMNNNLQSSALAQALQEALQYPYMSSSLSSVLPSLIGMGTQAEATQNQAQNVANLIAQSGGGQGPVMGMLSRLGQTVTGGPASFLGSNLNTQEQALAKDFAASGLSSPMLPQVTQNQSTVQQSLAGINRLLGALGGGQMNGGTALAQ